MFLKCKRLSIFVFNTKPNANTMSFISESTNIEEPISKILESSKLVLQIPEATEALPEILEFSEPVETQNVSEECEAIQKPEDDIEFKFNESLFDNTHTLADPHKSASDNFREFLKRAIFTKLFYIYCDAARAAYAGILLKQREDVEQEIPMDLATILDPFQEEFFQLNSNYHFRMMNNLDAWFFGIKNAGFWRKPYRNPKAGTIHLRRNRRQSTIIMEHGIMTMRFLQFSDQDKDYIIEEQKKREREQEDYIRMVVQLLNEYNY